jgi:hypothetical protein
MLLIKKLIYWKIIKKSILNNKSDIIYVFKTYHNIVDLYKIGKSKKFKELIYNCDKMSLKVRKSNKNIRQKGGYFIMLDKN